MRTRFVLLLVGMALVLPAAVTGAADRCSESPLKGSRELVLVVAPDWNSKNARLQRFTGSVSKGWKRVDAKPFDVVIGRNGLGWGLGLHRPEAGGPVKQEGDGRAPAGAFLLGDAFGYGDEVALGFKARRHVPYTKVDANSRCVDDVKSKFYNANVYDQRRVVKDWDSDEALLRTDDLYEVALTVAHNGLAPWERRGSAQVVPGRGSCIYLHVWRAAGGEGKRPGTAGCTAMEKDRMRELVRWVDGSARPVLVQLPLEEYRRVRAGWCLPEILVGEWGAGGAL